jgi:Uma2 family endonuclease
MATAALTRYKPEDLLAMPEEGRYELIDGQLVERNMGAKSSRVATRLVSRLDTYCEARAAGDVFQSDCGYQIFKPDRNRVRYADGSFIRAGRLPGDEPPEGHCRIPPDIVIESVSPNDTAPEIDEKVGEWLMAGVRLVWVLYPNTQRVYVHRRGRTVTKLSPGDELTGEDVLSGFKCRVTEIFQGARRSTRRARKS